MNAAVATSLLAVATALALARVFSGGGAGWRLLAAGIASGLLACAMERKNLLLATAVSAVGMVVAVGLWVFPDTTLHGLPTMHTLHAIGAASRQVGELARVQVAPTVQSSGFEYRLSEGSGCGARMTSSVTVPK